MHTWPNNFAEQLYTVGSLEDTYILKRLKKLNLSAEDATLIQYVGTHPGTRQKEIAQRLNRQAATISNMIKRLERRNLIIRRTDLTNSREKQVFLLQDGLGLITQIEQVTTDINQLILPAKRHGTCVNVRQAYDILSNALSHLD